MHLNICIFFTFVLSTLSNEEERNEFCREVYRVKQQSEFQNIINIFVMADLNALVDYERNSHLNFLNLGSDI